MTEEMIESTATSGNSMLALNGAEGMMSAPMTEADLSVSTAENVAVSEETLLEIIDFVEKIIENDAPANKEAMLDMVAYLEYELKAIQEKLD